MISELIIELTIYIIALVVDIYLIYRFIKLCKEQERLYEHQKAILKNVLENQSAIKKLSRDIEEIKKATTKDKSID